MKPLIALLLPFTSTMLVPGTAISQNKKINITWSTATQLPVIASMQKQLGVAGVFTGVSDDVLLIAGGSNFADGAKPWQGGKKIHKDDIYVLKKDDEGKFTWLTPKTKHLKQKVAYGASTTIAEGVICAGGETENAGSSKDVFIMSWDAAKQDVVFKHLPSLPIPVVNACMATIGKVIYLFGGESNGKPTDQCFKFNPAVKKGQWQALPPMPVAMSHSVAVKQSNGKYPCIYIIGGRSSTPSGISTLHNSTYCFDPKNNKWVTLSNVSDGIHTTTISAATAVAVGRNRILLIGGDKGNLFHQIETYNALIAQAKNKNEKQRITKEKFTYKHLEENWRVAFLRAGNHYSGKVG
jgi:N-acetylneuraminate epimerase